MEPISTALLAASAKEVTGPLATLLKRFGIRKYQLLTVKFQKCFQGHVESTLERCSTIKNILYRDQSVNFDSQYVNIAFSLAGKEYSDQRALSSVIAGRRALVCGTAGAGKTMFMRWSALELIRQLEQLGRIPLYLEMRYFEDAYDNEKLEVYIYKKTSSIKNKSTLGQFIEGLKAGIFIILLDAIDEVKPNLRDKMIDKLLDFLVDYPQCGIFISSRSNEKLESIQEFLVFRTMPMKKHQVVSVIEKLDYDLIVKKKLVRRLNGGLYEKLEEFLSNPLLATILLLTFDHSADIPTKLTAFYQQAFEALYQRHDAAKGAYKRDHYAGLPIDQFQSIFSVFSFQTYLNYKIEFSDGDLIKAIREACEYVQEKVDPQLFLKDAMESVCLLRRDGLDNVFSHRSFQEYFCAFFISRYKEENVVSLIDAVALIENESSVLQMLYEIAPETFEYEWVVPLLAEFISAYAHLDVSTKPGLETLFSAMFSKIDVNILGRAKSVSWSVDFTVAEIQAARWMSIINVSTKGIVNFYSSIFEEKIWDELYHFSSSLPINVRLSKEEIDERIITPNYAPHSMSFIQLSPEDSEWLIHSNLPKIFIDIVKHIQDYYSEIVKRRDARRSSVNNLLRRPTSQQV